MQKSRPSPVRIVIILAIANGILLLLGGFVASYFIPTWINSELDRISNMTDANQLNIQDRSTLRSEIMNVFYVIATVSVILGLAWFGVTWGLFIIKSWTWIATVILAIITIIFGILSMGTIVNFFTLFVSGIMLYFMFRPEVKSYFGRGVNISR